MSNQTTWQDKAVSAWLVIISLFQLYTATVGIYQPRIQRGIHLLFLLPVAFVLFPAFRKKGSEAVVGAVNWCLAALSILPPLYIVWFHERLTERLEFVD
ncbi:MAG TPA: C4-dicarboxylate ABC transporter permease, partial [Desulfobacteraceae bacterium]|nr:C4-dicarboxylate ABC transporter permease [Desulfobacteraceae bacterium]